MTVAVSQSIKKGQQVWAIAPADTSPKQNQRPALSYVRGVVVSVVDESVTIDVEDHPSMTLSPQDIYLANPALLDRVDNLTELTYLHEPGILSVLHDRYTTDKAEQKHGEQLKDIYTHAGPVLIAVNPFQPLPDLYSDSTVGHYVSRPALGAEANDAKKYTPHIFLTADKAFKQMRVTKESQSIIITGESGAGKTETTKFVMKYVAGLVDSNGTQEQQQSKSSMETKVLETNPILEAFGNAKTLHNNNSSRFGKLIDIHFEETGASSDGASSVRMCGAHIETYLLEKSRVVHQLAGERNYHVFYQLIRGAGEEVRRACMLEAMNVEDFRYLKNSQCFDINGVDDAEEFRRVCGAMSDIGITEVQQLGFWKTLACILFLGNVEFDKVSDDAAEIIESKALTNAAALMGVGVEALSLALTTKKMVAGGDVITMELNMEAAQEVRDALAKFLYEAQFRDLVGKVNEGIRDGSAGGREKGRNNSSLSLSLLDIYGFECFPTNSFEQLCINYANERLQQQFAAHLFKLEQAMYEEEGVDWTYVEFEDNQSCVDLIESKPPAGLGILTLLDEECLFPKGTDGTFAEKVCKTHSDHERFGFNANKASEGFTVHHYAGPVTYSADCFLDKNRDTLNPDLMNLVQSSESDFLASLSAHMGSSSGRQKMSSVGSRFREQLKALLERLDASQLHFVRCIKPNAIQQPLLFDEALVLHQLKCCGILEVARIARAGYPTRYGHKEFAERYKVFLPEDRGSSLENSVALLEHFGIDTAAYQVGKTKLFFRAGVLGHLEDHVIRANEACLTIQKTFRMHRCRGPYVRKRESALRIQAFARMRQARLEYEVVRRAKNAAACRVQSSFRGWRERSEYLRMLSASIALQRWWRQELLRQKIAEATRQLEQQEALASIDTNQDAENIERNPVDSSQALSDTASLCTEFGMSVDQIRNVLQLYVAGQLISTSDRPASPDTALQQLQKINVELQKEIEDLKDENALLVDQQAMQLSAQKQASKARVVAISADAGSPRSASSVSIMSYSDLQETENNSSMPSSSVRREMSFGRAGPEGAIAGLSAELSKKGPIFADDAAFIREVHEGVSLAPNMDPDFEIKRLIVRYKTWSRDFKARLKATQSSLKAKNGGNRSQAYVNASARPIGDPVNHSMRKGSNIFKSLLSTKG